LEFHRVAPDADASEIAQWHAAYVASETYQRTDASPYRLGEITNMIRVPTSYRFFGAWSAARAGVLVATGCLDVPMADNLHLAQPEVQVLPEFRRQGIGSALLTHLEDEARARGRVSAIAEVAFPLTGPDNGAGTPAVEFARAHGYVFALGDIQRRCALPIDPDLLDSLAAATAPHHADYRLVSFVGAIPDEWVAGYAALDSSMVSEAPMGDLDLENQNSSVEVCRDREAAIARGGMTNWHTLALDASGEPVAYTTVAVSAEDQSLCHQWGTLVESRHRGHRLGLAVKLANHRALQAAGAPAAEIATWNAAVNEHMISVNDLLGFHRVGRLGEFQKRL
jgi:GNAT superfamily N-acetyltransferase